jgi:hypothetical protein
VLYTKVHELISPITATWDEDLLQDIFNPMDVERILQIPINNYGFDDFIAWKGTRHGRYTVKSGYYIQWKHQFVPRAGQLALPGGSAQNHVWSILWKLQVPSKVKIFILMALHGIIPLKCILANMHIGDTAACPICTTHAEDIKHLLFECPAAREVWHSLNIQHIIDDATIVDRSGSAILEHILRQDMNEVLGLDSIHLKELVMITCWYMWWLRRRRARSEEVPPLNKCKMSILAITANAAVITKKNMISDVKWEKPKPREVKLNVDASFFQDLHAGAIGAVLRDCKGNFIAASSK